MGDLKPSLVYAVICDDVRFEANKKVSLMGLFDTLLVTGVPAVHQQLAVVAAWSGSKGTFKSEIAIVSPAGKVGTLGETKFTLPDDVSTHRHMALTYQITFGHLGIYKFRISLDNVVVRELPLKIEQGEPSPVGNL